MLIYDCIYTGATSMIRLTPIRQVILCSKLGENQQTLLPSVTLILGSARRRLCRAPGCATLLLSWGELDSETLLSKSADL